MTLHVEPLTHAHASVPPIHQETDVDALVIDDNINWSKAVIWALKKICPPDWDIRATDSSRTGGYLLVMDPDLKLALVDYFMPVQLGDEIIEEALKVRGHLRGKIIVCSGIGTYPPEVEEKLFVELGCRRLDKPIDFQELERVVLEVIGQPGSNG